MHGTIRREPLNGAIQFNTVGDFFTALNGGQQHDHHVSARAQHQHLKALQADFDRRDAAVADHVQFMIARMRARRA